MPVPCPICDGSMPKSRSPNTSHLMCRACWRTVPLDLRKEHRRFNDIGKAAGWPAVPAPESLRPAWRQCSAQCQRAAIIARNGGGR